MKVRNVAVVSGFHDSGSKMIAERLVRPILAAQYDAVFMHELPVHGKSTLEKSDAEFYANQLAPRKNASRANIHHLMLDVRSVLADMKGTYLPKCYDLWVIVTTPSMDGLTIAYRTIRILTEELGVNRATIKMVLNAKTQEEDIFRVAYLEALASNEVHTKTSFSSEFLERLLSYVGAYKDTRALKGIQQCGLPFMPVLQVLTEQEMSDAPFSTAGLDDEFPHCAQFAEDVKAVNNEFKSLWEKMTTK